MREFKFRVWSVTKKAFVDNGLSLWRTKGSPIATVRVNKESFIVQQYTGLKDKNGVEIYEGDLFTFSARVTVRQYSERRKGRRTGNMCSEYEQRNVVGVVTWGILNIGFPFYGWYIKTDDVESYNSAFYAGLGLTRSERRANESVPVTINLSRPLHQEIASGSVCGNIYEHPELLAEAA